VELEGEPWFVAKDVCDTLGLKPSRTNSYSQCTDQLEPQDKRTVTKSLGGLKLAKLFQGTVSRIPLISEAGLYALTMKARRRNPAIIKFQDWVTQEVLPSIRKTGAYVMGQEPVAQTGNRHNLILKAVFATKKCYKIDRCHG